MCFAYRRGYGAISISRHLSSKHDVLVYTSHRAYSASPELSIFSNTDATRVIPAEQKRAYTRHFSHGMWRKMREMQCPLCRGAAGNLITMPDEARLDISEIRESEARLRALFQHIQTGIVIIDPETHVIVDINPIAAELVGLAPEEIIGSVCHQYICPAAVGKCPITDLGQTIDRTERVLIKADRSKVAILKTVTAIELRGKQYLVESFVDITDTKLAEDRKCALLAYTSESVMRIHKPLEIMKDSLLFLAEQAERGELEPEELATALRVQMNHAGQMLETLQDLMQAVMEERTEVTPRFREFLLGGGLSG